MIAWDDESQDFFDERLRRLEETWRDHGSANFAELLPPPDHKLRRRTLLLLVQTDQELRWKHGRRKNVEEYLVEWPELAAFPDDVRRLSENEKLLANSATPSLAGVEGIAESHPMEGTRMVCLQCQKIVVAEGIMSLAAKCPTCSGSLAMDEVSAATLPFGSAKKSSPFPRFLRHFCLLERIGQGAFGEVWKAFDSKLNRHVAIKFPCRELFDDKELNRLLHEAQAPAELHHPIICTVYEVGQEGDLRFIVTELIDGMSLDQWAAAHRACLQPIDIAKLCAVIAEALDYAHRCGVLHRDLKPSNIRMDAEGQPHIVDFGLARRVTVDPHGSDDGGILGTPPYMPPEQASGQSDQADGRADIYSLGVILFELLAGKRPFSGDIRSLLRQAIEVKAPSVRQLKDGLPRDLEAICGKCLEKDREKRYASAGALAEDLRRYLRGEPIAARRTGPMERSVRWGKRNPRLAAMTLLAVSSLLAGIIASTLFAWMASSRAEDAKKESRQSKSLRLAAEARETFGRNPPKAVALALQASRATLDEGEIPPKQAVKTLRELLDSVRDQQVRRLLTSHATPLPCRNCATSVGILTPSSSGHQSQQVRSPLASPSAWISPDNRWLVTLVANNSLLRWDLSAEDPSSTAVLLSDKIDNLDSALITPDSRWLAVITSNDARLWNITAEDPTEASGDLSRQHDGGCSSGLATITKIAASRNSQWLTVSTCGCTQLYDLKREQPLSAPTELTRGGSHVTISDDSRWMVTQSENDDRLWDLAANDLLASPRRSLRENGKAVKCVTFAPDGKGLFAVRDDGAIVRWDLTAKKVEAEAVRFGTADDWQQFTSIHCDPTGTLLIGENPDELRIWDCKKNSLYGEKASFPSIVPSTPQTELVTQTSQDGRWMLAYKGNLACLFDLAKPPSGCKQIISENPPREILSGQFSPDNHWLLVLSSDSASLYNLQSEDLAKSKLTLPGCKVLESSPTFSSDGRWLATTGENHVLRLWDLKATNPVAGVKEVEGHPKNVTSMFFVRDQLVTWDNWIARLCNVANPDGTVRPSCQLPAYLGARLSVAAASMDGRWLIQADQSGGALVWDLAGPGDHCVARRLRAEEEASMVTITPDSHWAITANKDGTARLWDLTASDPTMSPVLLSGHKNEIIAMVVSPDSRWLITGSLDNTVRVWEIAADQHNRKPLVLAGHEAAVHQVIISPDSHWLLTESIDDTALLWELPSFDQCPLCLPWNGDKIPPGVKQPGSKFLIARTDPTSSLWIDQLHRFETPEAEKRPVRSGPNSLQPVPTHAPVPTIGPPTAALTISAAPSSEPSRTYAPGAIGAPISPSEYSNPTANPNPTPASTPRPADGTPTPPPTSASPGVSSPSNGEDRPEPGTGNLPYKPTTEKSGGGVIPPVPRTDAAPSSGLPGNGSGDQPLMPVPPSAAQPAAPTMLAPPSKPTRTYAPGDVGAPISPSAPGAGVSPSGTSYRNPTPSDDNATQNFPASPAKASVPPADGKPLTPEQQERLREALDLNGGVVQLYTAGRWREALPLAQKALRIRQQILGLEHKDTAQSLYNLGAQYHALGEYAKAEPLVRQASEIQKKVLGEDHADYADSLNRLASLYQAQGDYRRAELLY
ncbi:MAG: protein kinase domain-containing protein, partial [Thermoguttaceae bacterium]